MAYNEQDFLNGMAAGLAATNGRLIGYRKSLLTGVDRMRQAGSAATLPSGAFDTFVSRVRILTPSPVTILWEYGPADAATLTREFRRLGASDDWQTVHHAAQIAQGVALDDFRYNAYLVRQDSAPIRFDARFMAFPYYVSGVSYLYPGTPEQVNVWWIRTTQ